MFKPLFEERYRLLTDWDVFKQVCARFLKRSIRVNTLKVSVKQIVEQLSHDWVLTQVPWCHEGFWLEHREGRRDVGNLVQHALGYVYVQEAASMIPPVVLDPKPGEIVLDMCAAPGSKSSQLAQYMQNKGVLVSNDVKGERIAALGINLQRCGVSNVVVTQMQGNQFVKIKQRFDKVLVDAPCSGTGTIRKSLKTLRIWNPNMVRRLAAVQCQLLEAGFGVLRQGGTLVYSTCSCEPEENEAVLNVLLRKYPDAVVKSVDLPIRRSQPILEFGGAVYDSQIKDALRLWPQDNDTEGFFVCKIQKR